MIENLDMNICTEAPKNKRCYSCKEEHIVNHYVVAKDSVIVLCSECLEKLCIRGLERLGYKKIFKKYWEKPKEEI